MRKGNWIKLNRSIRKHFLWDFTKPLYLMAWIDILMSANYADKKVLVDSKCILVPRGSFVTSTIQLSNRWQCSRGTVNRILELLEQDNMITTERTRRYTTITVENYALYQDKPTTDDATDDTSNDTTDEQFAVQLTDNSQYNSQTTDDTTDSTQHKNNKEIYKNINKNIIKEREEREEIKEQPAPISPAEKKDAFHRLLDDNKELMEQIRNKYHKGENDAR